MANNAQNLQQQNMLARLNLLQTGIAMTKRIQPITTTDLGGQIKIPLLRMGIMTGVMLHFTVPVDITAAATRSPVGPWNFANLVTYSDFAGTQRTRTHGWQLFAAQSMKQGDMLSAISAATYGSGAGPTFDYDTNILNSPVAVGESEIAFSLYVPMAYDPASDLTGAVLTQTNVGEHYITVDLPSALVGADPWRYPFTAGTVALNGSIKVEAYQMYIQPQNMAAENLPFIDLGTVYGFEGAYQNSANIAAGQPTYINYPNNRSILSTLITFENGSQFTANGADLSLITVTANSNTNFHEWSPRLVREIQRNICNADLPAGNYYLPSRRQPIATQLYANVQAKMDVSTVEAGVVTQFISQFEVMYASGAPLPGIVTAGN